MKKGKITVTHKGVTVYISVHRTSKRGQPYTEFIISDYTTGERKRHVRSTEEAAHIKAREVCEALAGGHSDVLEWDESQRRDIHQALKLIEGTDIGIDRVAFIFSEAAKLVGVDEILTACQQWKNNRPDKPISPKSVSEAVTLFNDSQKDKVSQRRHRTVRSYLNAFGGPELSVRFLPLAALPHANYVAWSGGFVRMMHVICAIAVRQGILPKGGFVFSFFK